MQKCCDPPLTTSHKSKRSSMKTQSIQAENWNWKKRVECWLLKTEWTQFRRGSPFDSKKTWEKRHNKTKKRKQRNKKALVLVLLISFISLKFTPKSGFHTGTKSESVVDKAQTCWRVNRKPKPHTIKQIMFAFIPSPFMKSQLLPRQISIKKVIQVPTLLYVTSNLQFFRPWVRLFKCSEMLSSAQNFNACHYGTIIGQQTVSYCGHQKVVEYEVCVLWGLTNA